MKKLAEWGIAFLMALLIMGIPILVEAKGITGLTISTHNDCMDSDSSTLGDPEMSGSVYASGEVKSGLNVFKDYCDGDTVYERVCMADNSLGTFPFRCPKGCTDGACTWVQN